MGLKQNTTILAQLPLRQFGGLPAQMRSMWGRTDLRNMTVGEGIPTELAGIPAGHYAPSSWRLPYQAGQLSAFTFRGATFSGSLSMAAGVNLDGSSTFTFTVGPSQLELVVSATGSTSFAFTVSGNAAAVLQAVGAINVAFTVGPSTLGAESGVFGNSTFTFSGTATPRADGNISGAVTPFTELSPQSLAAAVWDALLANHTTVGSAGYALGNVSAGSSPEQIAAAILAAAQATPIHADTRKMNGATVTGTGAANDLWRGV